MPVNRAARGQLAWFEPRSPCPFGQENCGLTPSMLASVDIKLTQIDQHRQSRTGLLPFRRKAKPGGRNRPEFRYRAEAGSTCTPGPMVEDTATRFT